MALACMTQASVGSVYLGRWGSLEPSRVLCGGLPRGRLRGLSGWWLGGVAAGPVGGLPGLFLGYRPRPP